MLVSNAENYSSIGRVNPTGENTAQLNVEIKAMLNKCLEKTSGVALLKPALIVGKNFTLLNLRKNILTENVVQGNAKIFNMVKKSLEVIIRYGLEAQRDIGVAIGG